MQPDKRTPRRCGAGEAESDAAAGGIDRARVARTADAAAERGADRYQVMPNGTNSRRRGPAPDAHRAAVRAMFSEWSDRTFARYWKAHCRLAALLDVGAIDYARWAEVLAGVTRRNGSLNIAELERRAEGMAAAWVGSNAPEVIR